MKPMFSRNIDNRGRLMRAFFGVCLLAGAIFAWQASRVLCAVLLVSAGFVFFEAARGWCALRACGIKTKF